MLRRLVRFLALFVEPAVSLAGPAAGSSRQELSFPLFPLSSLPRHEWQTWSHKRQRAMGRRKQSGFDDRWSQSEFNDLSSLVGGEAYFFSRCGRKHTVRATLARPHRTPRARMGLLWPLPTPRESFELKGAHGTPKEAIRALDSSMMFGRVGAAQARVN
jgi:hypothetical protein